MTNPKGITDLEFDQAQQEVDRRGRESRKGSEQERAAFDALDLEWERLVAACDARSFADRQRADVAIRSFAVKNGLIKA